MRTNVRVSIAAVALSVGSLRAQTIEWLGLAPTLRNANADAVSADGSVIVGTGNGPDGVNILAYLWTEATGPVLVPPIPGFSLVSATGVSGDGSLVVGTDYSSDVGVSAPFSWDWRTGAGPTTLPFPPGDDGGRAYRVSRDGSTIVGSTLSHTGPNNFDHAVMWRGGAVTLLGSVPRYSESTAVGVSADGSVIVGNLWDPVAARGAVFRWTASGGMVVLAGLSPTRSAEVEGVSDDGRVAVGSSSPAPNITRMVRWRDAGPPEVLSPMSPNAGAISVSSDGRVIVGNYSGSSAALYSDQTGLVGLAQFLASRGIDLHGASLQAGQNLTPDGQYLVGNGWDGSTSTNNPVPWRVYLPGVLCYANCDASAGSPALNVNDFVCFLNHLAAGDAYANCDGSTTPPVINVLDFICFLNRFAAGCP
jgi:uncharacterized membrane protein